MVRKRQLGGNLKKNFNFYEASPGNRGCLTQGVGEECKSFKLPAACWIRAKKKPPVSGWKRAA
jgi:hypothetical protein